MKLQKINDKILSFNDNNTFIKTLDIKMCSNYIYEIDTILNYKDYLTHIKYYYFKVSKLLNCVYISSVYNSTLLISYDTLEKLTQYIKKCFVRGLKNE